MLKNCYKALCFRGVSQAGRGGEEGLRPIHHRSDGQLLKKDRDTLCAVAQYLDQSACQKSFPNGKNVSV